MPDCDAPRCGKPITFVNVTKKHGGRGRMVLDAEPDPQGNVAVRISGQSKIGRVITAGDPLDTDETLYMPHFATCTDPDYFRKRKTSADRARSDRQKATNQAKAWMAAQPDLFTPNT